MSQGQRGEVLKEWDWDGGVLLIHIVEAPEDGGTADREPSLAFVLKRCGEQCERVT